MEITIRKIELADAAVLSAISQKTFYDTFAGTCTEADMQLFLSESYNQSLVEKELNNLDNFSFFAEADGKPVGYIQFGEDYAILPLIKQWKAIELKRLYVLQEFHGKGVAQKLMGFILNYAAQNNYEMVWLGVWEDNIRAQKFYEKYGFVNSGHTHDFPIGGTPQTDKWFWKFLN